MTPPPSKRRAPARVLETAVITSRVQACRLGLKVGLVENTRTMLALIFPMTLAFYLPGVAPRDYLPGERVELKVNKLTSTKTQ